MKRSSHDTDITLYDHGSAKPAVARLKSEGIDYDHMPDYMLLDEALQGQKGERGLDPKQ